MDIRPIRTAEDLDWALSEIAPYFDDQPPLGSPEGARFEVLAALIDDYENKHFPIPAGPQRAGLAGGLPEQPEAFHRAGYRTPCGQALNEDASKTSTFDS